MTGARLCGGIAIAILQVAAPTLAAQSRQMDSAPAPPFESYLFIQYATTESPSPQGVLRLDNNGAIVLAARRGITKEALAAQVPFAESQITLLTALRLLEEDDDTLTTTFPILGSAESRRLREHTHAAALVLSRQLAREVRTLVKELRAVGREGNAYPILFSYSIDGLVWKEFERDSLVDVRVITAEKPFWAGEVWAIYPPRAFAPGTNTISEKGVSLKVGWTEKSIPYMLPFVTDIPALTRMFDDYTTAGVVKDEHVREVFGPFNLFDKKGRFTVPVIVEDDSNPLHHAAHAIAVEIAAQAPKLLDVPSLRKEFAFRDEKQALVVSYHELMWDVMDCLEADGLVRKPVAFAHPERVKPSDIADLVFIVKR